MSFLSNFLGDRSITMYMVSIRFQNPTQGPLITISLDDHDGTALAFVPAALSSAPADIAATSTVVSGTAGTAGAVGALAFAPVAAICSIMSGDSPSRVQPLRGLSRFASAVVINNEQATSDASSMSPVPVDLPGELTESTTTATDAAVPIDWGKLLQEDPAAFFAQVCDQVKEYKHEAMRRLDRGDSPESIIEWIQSEINPKLGVWEELITHTQLPEGWFGIKHDTGHKLADFSLLSYYLSEGDFDSAKEFCRTDLRAMELLFAQLRLTFAGRVVVERGMGFQEIELRSDREAEALLSILENLLRNAGDHPRPGVMPTIKIERQGNRLIVRDTAAGMDEATVQKLRDGVRIHDGKEIHEGRHGFGWRSIRETCHKLRITWHIQSEPGEGTTVILTIPDGLFVQNPSGY